MPDTVVVAIVSSLSTVISAYFAVRAANKLVIWRLDQLEKKMERHNAVQTRMLTAEINIRNLGCATGVEIVKGD